MRVVFEDEQLGVMETHRALALAREKDLDLVEISPNARPPVCKIVDYGKMKYDDKKRANEKKRNQKRVEVKEMKFRPKTDDHDMQFKCKHVRRFLEEGNRCKLVVFFRGREKAHKEIGRDLLFDVADAMGDISEITQQPQMEGPRMSILLSPRSRKSAKRD